MEKSVEFALSLAVDSMNSRKKQEERNLELEKLITEKDEIISNLQKEVQEQKEEADALRKLNQRIGDFLKADKKRDCFQIAETNCLKWQRQPEPCEEFPPQKNFSFAELVGSDDTNDEDKSSSAKASSSSSESSKRTKSDDDASWIVREPVFGGPHDNTVIPSFLGHVASRMSGGEMRGLLGCGDERSNLRRLKEHYMNMSEKSPKAKEIIDQSGLSHLFDMQYEYWDTPLITAFVERWQPDTNSFHLPFGEMTIMLHDVWHILRIPVEGKIISDAPEKIALYKHYMRTLGLSKEEAKSCWSGVYFDWREGDRSEETQATAWLCELLDSALFVEHSFLRNLAPSRTSMHELVGNLDDVGDHSWGSAALAFLYHQLGVATRGLAETLAGGCIALLQAWIYEYFPCFRPHQKKMTVDGDSPRASMWTVLEMERSSTRLRSIRRRLDRLKPSQVSWLPYGSDPKSSVPRTIFTGWIRHRDVIEAYMPGRALRQLGYVQTIPDPITTPTKAIRKWLYKEYKVEHCGHEADEAWKMFPNSYVLPLSQYQPASEDAGACDPDYINWYYRHSHPLLLKDSISFSSESSSVNQ